MIITINLMVINASAPVIGQSNDDTINQPHQHPSIRSGAIPAQPHSPPLSLE
jgi:hypothetical protein